MMRAAALCLLLTACGCSQAVMGVSAFQPAILRDSLPPDKDGRGRGGVTLCAENNVPYIVLDWSTKGTLWDEGVRVHEIDHADSAFTHRGGCWPWLRRYASDSSFRIRQEFAAYCAEARFLMTRNMNAEALWAFIRKTMRERYGYVQSRNCLYDEGGN